MPRRRTAVGRAINRLRNHATNNVRNRYRRPTVTSTNNARNRHRRPTATFKNIKTKKTTKMLAGSRHASYPKCNRRITKDNQAKSHSLF